jgi:hypothetical protein
MMSHFECDMIGDLSGWAARSPVGSWRSLAVKAVVFKQWIVLPLPAMGSSVWERRGRGGDNV